MYFVLLVSTIFFFAVVGVVSCPSPCFGTLFLVLSSCVGCGVVAEMGFSFAAFILFLIYLGGMLVVFAYSVSLCGDLHPLAINGRPMFGLLGFYVMVGYFGLCEVFLGDEGGQVYQFDSGVFGASLLYSSGGYSLMVVGFGLLLTLVVVTELARGVSFVSQKVN